VEQVLKMLWIYVCESVQEQIGQVLAKLWVLKAWLNQPIIRQVQVSTSICTASALCLRFVLPALPYAIAQCFSCRRILGSFVRLSVSPSFPLNSTQQRTTDAGV